MMELPAVLSAADAEALYSLIGMSMQADDGVRKPAEEALRRCEDLPGFLDALLAIVVRADAAPQARLMAVICLKNLVTRCWKARGRARGMSAEERARLKAFVLAADTVSYTHLTLPTILLV